MNSTSLTPPQIETLGALAQAIIPPDNRDAGVSSLNPGPCLAKKIEADLNATPHLEALQFAETTARANFGRRPSELDAPALEKLILSIRDHFPAFFKFLRAETCALYLSDPATWKRIGFPGPSILTGGYPDFDQPQHRGDAKF